MAILPYYVANLNIEATYAAITGQFAEYPNLCFVDTLDNVAALGTMKGEHFGDLLGGVSVENMARVKRQNERKISVIIGNPPYNANQQNENDNNKNRAYARIDERIKQTYIKASTAQKTKLYDMYSRFFRWASDRLTEDGVLAFITNRSFIESRTFDGFRKMVAQDFNEIWVVDLGGDVRANPKLSGTKHNVFGIQTGVAICYLVRKKGVEGCTIRYVRRPEDETAEDKLSWLGGADLKALPMTVVKPNARHDWINVGTDDFEALLPLTARSVVLGQRSGSHIFGESLVGILTGRDDWVVDRSKSSVDARSKFFLDVYNDCASRRVAEGTVIKWSENLKRFIQSGTQGKPHDDDIRPIAYRPFTKLWMNYNQILVDRPGKSDVAFPATFGNQALNFSFGPRLPFTALVVDAPSSYSFYSLDPSHYLPCYRYTKSGERVDNITDWAVAQFVEFYSSKPLLFRGGEEPRSGGGVGAVGLAPSSKSSTADKPHPNPSPEGEGLKKGTGSEGEGLLITRDAIFAYCYAVLHDPLYREKYALNLKREFPRIPFYPDFAQWVAWGEALLKLHIDYEKVKPAKLTRVDTPAPKRAEGTHPKPKLKSNAATGNIVIDEDTQLTGVPVQAWDYRLGNRSAIDWVLDQHKEKTPRDPTIRAKFNTYRFADYKQSCIDLLGRVVTVSVETVAITEAMKAAKRE